MKTILDLLVELNRNEVAEVAIVTGHLPCVKVHGKFQPVDKIAPTSFQIREWLCELGGLLYVDALASKPVQWQTRVDDVGRVVVIASATGDVVQVRVARVRGRASLSPRRSLRPPKTMPEGPAAPSAGERGSPRDPRRDVDIPAHAGVPLIESSPAIAAPRSAATRTRPPAAPSKRIPSATIEAVVAGASDPVIKIAAASAEVGDTLVALLVAAKEQGASDLHVIAGRPALLRIAAELLPQGTPITEGDAERMLMAIVPARLRSVLDRDGSADFALDDPRCGRSRVNISRQRTGFKGAFRLIPREVPSLESLGLPPEIGGAVNYHQGLIVLTGPTGHGKTTTLAALVNLINETTTHHVLTVEDPVEYIFPKRSAMISQREVGTHTVSFASALKASLREDPDVIVVGELRDTETVRMALAASETGHLVIGTMNTQSAAKTIDRLIDLFPPGDQQQVRMTLAGGLRLVVSQRLLPNADGTGLVAAAEVLPGSVALWNMIRDDKTYQIPSLQQRGRAAGIVRLDDSLAELVRSGRTTLEVARGYAVDVEELLKKTRSQAAEVAAPEPAPQPAVARGDLLSRAGALWRRKD